MSQDAFDADTSAPADGPELGFGAFPFGGGSATMPGTPGFGASPFDRPQQTGQASRAPPAPSSFSLWSLACMPCAEMLLDSRGVPPDAHHAEHLNHTMSETPFTGAGCRTAAARRRR